MRFLILLTVDRAPLLSMTCKYYLVNEQMTRRTTSSLPSEILVAAELRSPPTSAKRDCRSATWD